MTSKIVVNNIEADSGINTVTFGGDISGNFVGNVTGNVNSTGVSTFSDTVNVGAGKSVRIFGSASGYSDLIAPAVAGDQTFTLPGTGGTLDRLNRAGNILQVVYATYSTEVLINTSTFTDTNLTGSITPTSASSKILVMINQQVRNAAANPTTLACRLKLLRGSTSIFDFANTATGFDSFEVTADSGGNVRLAGYISVVYLDTPATTSSTTYKTQASTNAGIHAFQSNSSPSIMTLMEVAA